MGQQSGPTPSVGAGTGELVEAPQPQGSLQPVENVAPPAGSSPGDITGTVVDINGDLVPGASIVLQGGGTDGRRALSAGDNGFFELAGLRPGVPYHITVSANGFEDWVSPVVVLTPGQYMDLMGIKLKIKDAVTSVTVYASTEQIATEQVHLEEHQRVLGIVPNFYVVYDAKNAVPLTTKLKFQMAFRVSVDPISFIGAAFLAGVNQAANTPDYVQGAKGYGQRMGAVYTDGLTDIMFGGAILPSLLHQDPRYFYQGTGTVKSRMLHAMSNPFIARGDNGRLQPNYSSVGGDLVSSSLSNLYYPRSNRGAGLVFDNLLISTAERTASSLVQEFVLRKLTRSSKE